MNTPESSQQNEISPGLEGENPRGFHLSAGSFIAIIVATMVVPPLLIATLTNWPQLFPEQRPPRELPSPPMPPLTIAAIWSTGFYDVEVGVAALDGSVFSIRPLVDGAEWDWEMDARLPGVTDWSTNCTRAERERMEDVSGPLAECRTGAIWGEQCGGGDVVIGLGKDGRLWARHSPDACTYYFNLALLLTCPCFLLIGAFVGVMSLFYAKTGRQFKPFG